MMAVPIAGTKKRRLYTLLGWKGRLADETIKTIATTLFSASWFFDALEQSRRRKNLLTETIHAVFRAVDIRDPITGGHSDRVAKLCLEILKEMDLPEEDKDDIYLGSLIHDIGKIGIADAVLNKPDRLDADEFAKIKTHPTLGKEIMETVPLSDTAKRTVYEHHERYDGSGYPNRLSGEQVSLGARILSVADVYDALVSDRPYRKGKDPREVCDYIYQNAGTKFDRDVVEIFLRLKAPDDWKPSED
jgi:HD-GYP domain-containing protein (c-di-GMP phosphodiesterase class II)